MDSLYWRQFMLSAGMVLLTMVLLGVSFYALSYNYTVEEKRSEMRDRANLISQLSVNYLLAGDDTENTQEDALRSLAGVHACGHAWMVPQLAKAAVAAGADGLMIEVHNNPAKAKCDGAQSLTPDQFDELMGFITKEVEFFGKKMN